MLVFTGALVENRKPGVQEIRRPEDFSKIAS